MEEEMFIHDDLHTIEYLLDGLKKDKAICAGLKDANSGDRVGPQSGPLANVVTDLVINRMLPDIMNRYGPDLTNAVLSAIKTWLTQKATPPAAA